MKRKQVVKGPYFLSFICALWFCPSRLTRLSLSFLLSISLLLSLSLSLTYPSLSEGLHQYESLPRSLNLSVSVSISLSLLNSQSLFRTILLSLYLCTYLAAICSIHRRETLTLLVDRIEQVSWRSQMQQSKLPYHALCTNQVPTLFKFSLFFVLICFIFVLDLVLYLRVPLFLFFAL